MHAEPHAAPLPDQRAIMARAGGENFPVAMRLLPRREREQLLAIYGFARLVDELGDTLVGDRLVALDRLSGELERAYGGGDGGDGGEGRELHPLMGRLQRVLGERARSGRPLPREPFERLIAANRADQHVKRYVTFEQLMSYCELSANPVGELVLAVFGAATPERIARSNQICSALQLAEHWQDVAEDHRAGRVYIPAEDLECFGVDAESLLSAGLEHRRRMRALMQFEVQRARGLLDAGTPLVWMLKGRAKLAVAGFAAGGRAALGAIERAGFEVLDRTPNASRPQRAWALAGLLAGGAR